MTTNGPRHTCPTDDHYDCLLNLIARLREQADWQPDSPWWWDAPEKGGPGGPTGILREAADALESLLNDGTGAAE
jgi:hypothetical protein